MRSVVGLVWRVCGLSIMLVIGAAPLAAEPPKALNARIADQLGYLDIRVMTGRVRVTSDDPTRDITIRHKETSLEEQVQIHFGAQGVSLEFTRTTPAATLHVQVVDGREFVLRREAVQAGDPVPLLFVQPVEGRLQLVVGADGASRSIEAPSLWQLYLAAPEECRQALFPLLELFRPDWQLVATAEEIQRRLGEAVDPGAIVDRAQIEQWIEQLGAAELAQRRRAERQLSELSPAVIPLLTRYADAELDPEQRRRRRRVLAALGTMEHEDTASGATAWLSGDVETWLIGMRHDDAGRRAASWDRLCALLRDELGPFDPQAAASVRAEQLRALERRLGRETRSPQP